MKILCFQYWLYRFSYLVQVNIKSILEAVLFSLGQKYKQAKDQAAALVGMKTPEPAPPPSSLQDSCNQISAALS